jgi:hypothetical protein
VNRQSCIDDLLCDRIDGNTRLVLLAHLGVSWRLGGFAGE